MAYVHTQVYRSDFEGLKKANGVGQSDKKIPPTLKYLREKNEEKKLMTSRSFFNCFFARKGGKSQR
jgi:hypothetical protein